MTAPTVSAIAASVAAVGTIGTLLANSLQIARLQSRQRREDEMSAASLVSAWIDQGGARILNKSEAPIYNVVVCQVFVQGAAPTVGEQVPADHKFPLQLVPPTSDGVLVLGLPGPQGMNTVPAVELSFQDSHSRSWIRRADGRLVRIDGDVDPFRHYKIELPISYSQTSRVYTGLVASSLISGINEVIASLRSIAVKARSLRTDADQARSRAVLATDFERCSLAISRVELMLPSVGVGEEGYWLLAVGNNLAASLLQAEDYDGELENTPVIVNGEAKLSPSIYTAEMAIADLPMPTGVANQPLDEWWKHLVENYGEPPSVYDPDGPHMTQHSRLVEDYVREYLMPWAQKLIADRLR